MRRERSVLQNLERFAMYSDPMPETTPADRRRAVVAVFETPPKEMTMERYYGPFKHFWARAAAFAAAFATSATLLLAIVGAFYGVSSEPVLADSPQARSAVADCDARGDRVARQHCARRLVASAKAHDAGASQLACARATSTRRGAVTRAVRPSRCGGRTFPTNKGLIAAVGESHALAANAPLAVAALHAAAALMHHCVWEDGVLRRMLPIK